VGFLPFVKSFVLEVFQEDFNMITSLSMFTNLQITFVMFSLCYAQWPSYLQRIVFPSLCILQHSTEFDACTITMLRKLLALGSFGTIMGHLACCQVILFTFLGGLSLPLGSDMLPPPF
jgi:hypothetical protein